MARDCSADHPVDCNCIRTVRSTPPAPISSTTHATAAFRSAVWESSNIERSTLTFARLRVGPPALASSGAASTSTRRRPAFLGAAGSLTGFREATMGVASARPGGPPCDGALRPGGPPPEGPFRPGGPLCGGPPALARGGPPEGPVGFAAGRGLGSARAEGGRAVGSRRRIGVLAGASSSSNQSSSSSSSSSEERSTRRSTTSKSSKPNSPPTPPPTTTISGCPNSSMASASFPSSAAGQPSANPFSPNGVVGH